MGKLPDLNDFNTEIAEETDVDIATVARVMSYVYRKLKEPPVGSWRDNLLSAVLRSQIEMGDDKTAEYDQK